MFLVIIMVSSVNAIAIVPKNVGVTLIPAPVGFIYKFDNKISDVVGVYLGRNYKRYYAKSQVTGSMFYPDYVTRILTKRGRYNLLVTPYNSSYSRLALNTPGSNDLILLSMNGYVYVSPYRLIFNPYKYKEFGKNDIIVTNKLNLDLDRNVKFIVPVTSKGEKITLISKNFSITEKVADVVGVQDSCIAFVSHPLKDFPWYGGLIPTPLCTKNVVGIIRDTYNGQPLYTVFSTSIRGHVVYFIFSKITPYILVRMGILNPVQTNPSVHVILTKIDGLHIYYAPAPYITSLLEIKTINAFDSTVINGNERLCILPVNSKVIFHLTWDLIRENTSRITMKPGEVLVYEAGNSTYLCRGDMSFLKVHTPVLSLPSIKQLHEPVKIISGKTALVMLGNGKIYYGTKIKIPYKDYDGNTVWLISMYPHIITIQPKEIWSTPFFWLSILLGILFTALILQKPRTRPRKIKVIWDISTPPPMSFADKETIRKRVSQYIEMFGVCPDDVELAERGVLLPVKDEKPTDEVIVCNFKTNVATEKILRKLVRTANMGFWSFKRRGKSSGYLYTLIGDTLILFYVYKQEDEKEPSELLLNAIKSAMKTYVGIPLHKKYHGIIIVTTPEMRKKLLEELKRSRVIDESGRVGDIGPYLSYKFPDMDEGLRNNIINFVKSKVPLIVVVDNNVIPIIEVLGEIASQYYEEYLRIRGEKYE